ncbi:MAG: hypothetical protein FWE57_02210 [Chitinispirillia bacterium]|nr:hypothetical protein [Chitinispirillia bacterium]
MESLHNFFAPVPAVALIGVIFMAVAVWLFFKNLRMPSDFPQRERARNLLKLRLLQDKKDAYLKSIMENTAAKKSAPPAEGRDEEEDSVSDS